MVLHSRPFSVLIDPMVSSDVFSGNVRKPSLKQLSAWLWLLSALASQFGTHTWPSYTNSPVVKSDWSWNFVHQVVFTV